MIKLMIRISLIGALVISWMVISCSGNSKENIISTYPSGEVKIKRIYPDQSDTIKYIQLVYLEDGRLADSGMIVNGKLEGQRKIYEAEEKKIYITNYANGIESGATSCFYESGILYYQGQIFNGNEIGSYYFYEEDGSLLEYDYYITSGVAYRWEFDDDGNYVRSLGSALVQYRTEMDSAKIGSIFPIEIDLAVPEGCISSISGASTRNQQAIEFESEKTIGDTRTMTYNYISKHLGNDTVYFHWNVLKIGTTMQDSGMTVVPLVVFE